MNRAFLCAMIVLASACGTPELAGTYAGALPASFGAGDERQVRVTLKPGGEAALQATFLDSQARYFGDGRWRQEGARVALEVAGDRPQRLVFSRSGDQLVATAWDRKLWGEAGPPVLYKLFRR
jgi:hypothetical protein